MFENKIDEESFHILLNNLRRLSSVLDVYYNATECEKALGYDGFIKLYRDIDCTLRIINDYYFNR